MTSPTIPPLVPRTADEQKARNEKLAELSETYKRDAEQQNAAKQRREDAKQAAERNTPESKAARMKANTSVRRKLYRMLKTETDPMKRRALEVQIETHKEPRPVAVPNRNRKRGYRNQNGMLRKA